ncbi:MAG: septum formation inhibitor Maf [Ignavibacteria bacterium]|nr:septum formation inhibitor Maf [Ignavibacteria bacterium]
MRLPFPLVLASQSPRRQSLLRHIGFDFTIVNPDIDEDSVPHSDLYDKYVEHIALLKARRGLEMATGECIVLGSDTTVVLDGQILNKPTDRQDAKRILSILSGNTHTVFTGIALTTTREREVTASRSTRVTFRSLSQEEIDAYVDSGSPMDKAGAYGIQDDFGAVFVSHVEGCYYTIVGLPVELLYTTLRDFVRQELL